MEQNKAFELLKVILTRPLARVFWRRAVRKAVKMAAYLEELQK